MFERLGKRQGLCHISASKPTGEFRTEAVLCHRQSSPRERMKTFKGKPAGSCQKMFPAAQMPISATSPYKLSSSLKIQTSARSYIRAQMLKSVSPADQAVTQLK